MDSEKKFLFYCFLYLLSHVLKKRRRGLQRQTRLGDVFSNGDSHTKPEDGEERRRKDLDLNKIYFIVIFHNSKCRFVYHNMLEDYTDCGATEKEVKKQPILINMKNSTREEKNLLKSSQKIFFTSRSVFAALQPPSPFVFTWD